jgi:hypothetical protein
MQTLELAYRLHQEGLHVRPWMQCKGKQRQVLQVEGTQGPGAQIEAGGLEVPLQQEQNQVVGSLGAALAGQLVLFKCRTELTGQIRG